jgi:hypothetical protein
MSVYTYEAMKEIYLTEKARKEEERRKHEEEKFNTLLPILEGYVIEAIKQGKSSCYLELDRLKDGKKPAIEESKIDLYMKRLQEIFPDTSVQKFITTERSILHDKEKKIVDIEIKWKKFD